MKTWFGNEQLKYNGVFKEKKQFLPFLFFRKNFDHLHKTIVITVLIISRLSKREKMDVLTN